MQATALLTCPQCGTKQPVEIPTNACQYFYTCVQCQTTLKPKTGDCCVICSYADTQCLPKQEEASQH